MRWISKILSVALIFALVAQASAEITVQTIENRNHTGTSLKIEDGTKLILVGPRGDVELTLEDIVEIRIRDSIRRNIHRPDAVTVYLTSGEAINGNLMAPDVDENVRVSSPSLGEQSISLDVIDRIVFNQNEHRLPSQRPESEDGDDILFLANRDLDTGTINEMNPEGLKFDSTILGGERTIDPKGVAAIYLSLWEAPTPLKGLTGIVILVDGSVIQGSLVSAADGQLLLRRPGSDEGAEPSAVAIEKVSSIFFKNGRVIYASDLEPSTVKENSFFDAEETLWPFQKDRSVFHKEKISIEGLEYRKGLGVHATSELTYALPEGVNTFAATVGLDDESEGKGSVVFEVLVDGEVMWSSGPIIGRDESPVSDAEKKGARDTLVDVAGAKEVTLRVRSARFAEIRDRAAWGNARFIR